MVSLGRFCCAADDENFARAGEVTRHCFVFPRRGVWIQHEGKAPFVADSTRVTLYNPHQQYERRALDPEGDDSDWITLSESVVRDVVARFDAAAADSATLLRFAYSAAPATLYLAQRRLHQYVRLSPSPDPLFVEETAIGFFAETVAGAYRGVPTATPRPLTRRQRDLAEDVRAYLNQTFMATVSLGMIADALGASMYHLCRVFRRSTGLTMNAYRHHLRLRHSLDHLGPAADLMRLALDLGYSGHSHFTSVFRREFRVVPSELRDWISNANMERLRADSTRRLLD